MTGVQELDQSENRRARIYLDLFLISFLVLFLELACIRWFGSMVPNLTFFTNIALLATFLGISAGCLAASSRQDQTRTVIPLLLMAVVASCFASLGRVAADVGGQGASPQQVYFGTEYLKFSGFVLPIDVLASIYFILIALAFVGVGQAIGLAFDKAPYRLVAYTSNIGGSLAGIAAFALASYFRTTPLTWFAVALILWLYFLKPRNSLQIVGLVAILILVGFASYTTSPRHILMWSP